MIPPTTPPAGLDFASIRQQYPAAFAALDKWAETLPKSAINVEWLGLEYEMSSDITPYTVPTNPRDLFDFFDQQGVYVSMMPYRFLSPIRFSYKVVLDGESLPAISGYPTRPAAESAAFMAAFGKLEDRLKQETR